MEKRTMTMEEGENKEERQVVRGDELRSCPSFPRSKIQHDCRSVQSNFSDRSMRFISQLEEQHRKKSAHLRLEIELAKAEAKAAKRALADSQLHVLAESQGSDMHLRRYLLDCETLVKDNAEFHPLDMSKPVPLVDASSPVRNRDCCSTDRLADILSGLQLPKVELPSFDGNPVNYLKFTRIFEQYVEMKVSDPGQRLLQLLNYCRGKAREAIDECILLPPSEAFCRAKNILKDLFGQPHVVARSMINDVLEQARSVSHSGDSLTRLAIKMQNVDIALKEMHYVADLNAMHTLEGVVRYLPHRLQIKWAEHAETSALRGNYPVFSDLTEFVLRASKIANSRFGQLAERNLAPHRNSVTQGSVYRSNKMDHIKARVFATCGTVQVTCSYCKSAHQLRDCPSFQECDINQRWTIVKRLGICFNCLNDSHISSKCRVRLVCGKDGCRRKHHILLHHPTKEAIAVGGASVVCATTNLTRNATRLGIVPVMVNTPKGLVQTLAFLDSGSNTSLIKRSFLERVELKGIPTNLTISTLNGVTNSECVKVSLTLWSVNHTNPINVDEAFSVENIPVKAIKSIRAEAEKWPHLKGVTFHDNEECEVNLLLGCDVSEAHYVENQRLGGKRQPYATLTAFGWVLCGPLSNAKHSVNCTCGSENLIVEQLNMLYNNEFRDLTLDNPTMSRNDKLALDTVSTGIRLVDGHFEVPLPWNNQKAKILNNVFDAGRRLAHLKRRFLKDEVLRRRYAELIQRHIDLGYIERAPSKPEPPNIEWYMPHHPVINSKKPEKLRIVFDCAAKYKGISLNEALLQGPDLTSKLVDILLRFRSYSIAVAADIEEMFLQVRVPKVDRDALRILWWPNGLLEKEPEVYRKTVHPFGATSSPFCANYALRVCADRFGAEFPQSIREAAIRHFYVDDCLASFPDSSAAVEFSTGLTNLLGRGGFRLTKWISNDRFVLSQIPSLERAVSVREFCTNSLPLERTLGIKWDVERDVFVFHFHLNEKPLTRRGLLSALAGLYDPLGMVAPWLLPGKILLQELCRRKLGWDQPLEDVDRCLMLGWLESLKRLEEICVPRCILTAGDSIISELHVFSDASEVGYGVVAYALLFMPDGTRECKLLFSKARVAPLKTVSIPRLELSAAGLAVRLSEVLKKAQFMRFTKVTFWTDSTIVLYYINNESSRFCTFVANRLAMIHDVTSPGQWRFVPSECNPADRTSRGLIDLHHMSEWLKGPTFLTHPSENWPSNPVVEVEENIELKKGLVSINVTQIDIVLSKLWNRFSNWHKLLKSVVWLIRFKRYLSIICGIRSEHQMTVGQIKVFELDEAEMNVIRLVQGEVFPTEISTMSSARIDTLKSSSLRKLCPVMIDGILRVGGRLSNAQLPFDMRHPIILPKKHPVTRLIIRNRHLCEGHIGASHLLARLRERFWIPHGAAAVKEVLRSCMVCRRQNALVGSQLMAPLPGVRVNIGWHPFSCTGLDYFGPLNVKLCRSVVKRYGCVFTCMKTRAVHIEVAHSMTTDSFIMALTRFIGRRGPPSDVFSDNGSNFIGAERELKNWMQSLDNDRISQRLLCQRVQWHFTPPYASHRGGSWERIIRSIRKVLSSILSEQTPTDEVLTTTLIEVERILNNRPIVPLISGDHENLALTPNNLLLLRGNTGLIPNYTVLDRYRSHWKQAQYLASLFWRRWIREYIPTLQARQRWILNKRNFTKGDVVLVVTDGLPRDCWPLGLITDCLSDDDGLVRTVVVKTKHGIVKRDIRRLCLLEGYSAEDELVKTSDNRCWDVGSPQMGGGSSGLPHQERSPETNRPEDAVPVGS